MVVMNPQLQSVLDRLERVKQTGSGYSAQCPSHDDSRNSLSINLGDDGRILLHCFAGCSVDAICAGIELDLKDLFPQKSLSRQLFQEEALPIPTLGWMRQTIPLGSLRSRQYPPPASIPSQ